MSYTYLLEREGESWEECSSDTPQFALWKLNLTAEKSYSKDNETASCQSSQSGMMSPHSTELRGEERSMSSRGVFPVKTSQAREEEPGSQESEADFGQKWPESLAKFDPNTHSWRTHQCLLFEDLTECLAIFPRWGMMHDGELWGLDISADHICEKEYGYLPTPNAGMFRNHNYNKDLCIKRSKKHQTDICMHSIMYWNGPIKIEFLEGMMGWPLMWTELNPLEMDKFQLWLQQHGESLEENK
jgi:hypothetical protein